MMKNMKKKLAVFTASLLILLTGCSAKSSDPQVVENSDGSISITRIDEDGKAIKYNQKFDGAKDVTEIDLSKTTRANPVVIDLSAYEGKDVEIQLSCDMYIQNKSDNTYRVIWMVNEIQENFPKLYEHKQPAGKWFSVNKRLTVHLSGKRQLYVSGSGFEKDNTKIYIKNFKLRLNGDGLTKNDPPPLKWTEAPGIKDVYKDYFDYFGFCVSYNNTFRESLLQKGLPHQASVITMENEFKPDFIFGWSKPAKLTEFRGEDGNLYEVPADIPNFKQMDSILSDMKKLGLKLRGHTLVWHSQTPAWFFMKNFSRKNESDLVTPEEMNARMEWYIKSVMEHVAEWEKKNNNPDEIDNIIEERENKVERCYLRGRYERPERADIKIKTRVTVDELEDKKTPVNKKNEKSQPEKSRPEKKAAKKKKGSIADLFKKAKQNKNKNVNNTEPKKGAKQDKNTKREESTYPEIANSISTKTKEKKKKPAKKTIELS